MSIPLPTKSESDVSSNSSWSVISNSEESDVTCEEKVILENDSDNENKDVQDVEKKELNDECFFDIHESSERNTEESENENQLIEVVADTHERSKFKSKPKTRKLKKIKRKAKSDTFNLLSIAASVLTITGLTFLCMLFPQNFEKETVQDIQKSYVDIVTTQDVNPDNYINKTVKIFDVLNETDFFKKMKDTVIKNEEDELCSVEEVNDKFLNEVDDFLPRPMNFVFPAKFDQSTKPNIDLTEKVENPSPYNHVQNKTLSVIKNIRRILMDPNLQIFICTVLQDICLIKLVNQINKHQLEKSRNDDATLDKKRTADTYKKKKLQKTSNTKRKPNLKSSKKVRKISYGNIDGITKIDNGQAASDMQLKGLSKLNSSNIKLNFKFNQVDNKTECERKFEELENKWETAGQIHRQRVQEIKDNFKNEVFLIKENEKEYELRKRRIQLLREKYVERLRFDREKYLIQLQKLREERQKIMTSICLQKSKETYLKDASVGNYAVLLPESYSFQQKIQLLKNKNNDFKISLPSIPTASFPRIGAVKNSKFMRYQSIPNIPKQEVSKEKGAINIDVKREKYLERLKKFYEKSNKYLQKKSIVNEEQSKIFDSKAKMAETIGEAFIEDLMSHMAAHIVQPSGALHNSSSNSSVETVKASESSENDEEVIEVPNAPTADITKDKIEPGFKLVVKKRPKKRDLYDVAFDGNSKKVKQEDMKRWNSERRERLVKLQQHQILTKQDPHKTFKEKIIIKGHM